MSLKYGTVDNGIWQHQAFKALPDQAKLLFFYFKTCQHSNMIGCYHIPMGYMSVDMGWSEKEVFDALKILCKKEFAKYDRNNEFIFLPRHLYKHPLQNPKQILGAYRMLSELPSDFAYLDEIIDIYNSLERVTKPYAKGMQRVCKGFETGLNSVTVTRTVTVTTKPTLDEVKEFVEKKGYTAECAEKAFNHYDSLDWHNAKGKEVKNWKNTIANNWFKPEFKKEVVEWT
jgi:hypothetical protein